jgi:hypothetical protein
MVNDPCSGGRQCCCEDSTFHYDFPNFFSVDWGSWWLNTRASMSSKWLNWGKRKHCQQSGKRRSLRLVLTVKLRTKIDPGRIMMYPMHRRPMTELPGIWENICPSSLTWGLLSVLPDVIHVW